MSREEGEVVWEMPPLEVGAAGGAGRVPRMEWAWWYEQRHEVGMLAAGRAGCATERVGLMDVVAFGAGRG